MYYYSEFSKLKAEHFAERLRQENLARKNDIIDFVKKVHILMKN